MNPRLDHIEIGVGLWCTILQIDCGILGPKHASVYYRRLHKQGEPASVQVRHLNVAINPHHHVEWRPPADVAQSIAFRVEEDLDYYEMPDGFPPEHGAELEDMG